MTSIYFLVPRVLWHGLNSKYGDQLTHFIKKLGIFSKGTTMILKHIFTSNTFIKLNVATEISCLLLLCGHKGHFNNMQNKE